MNQDDILKQVQAEIHTRLCLLWDEGLLTRENAAQEVNLITSKYISPPELDIKVDILSKGDRVIEVNVKEK